MRPWSPLKNSGNTRPKSALIVGGYGFIGSNVAAHLLRNGWHIRIFDRVPQIQAASNLPTTGTIEAVTGDLLDKECLREALQGMGAVLYFAAHSVPSSNPRHMTGEIEGSMRSLDNLLSVMVDMGSATLVFPSSGGTVYGACKKELIAEDDSTAPISSYGMGKLLCEDLIKFYHRVHGLKYQILRVSNVYGCPFPRKVNQGVVDIFLQKIVGGLPIEVWGNPENVRDYIFIEDLCRSIARMLEIQPESDIYNVGTGIGHTVIDVIRTIEAVTGKRATVNFVAAPEGTLSRNVLDISKIRDATGWTPDFSLTDGINLLHRRLVAHMPEICLP